MNKIDKIRAEIEHRIKANKTKNGFPAGTLCAARIEVYEDLISFINSIPEEPDKSLDEEIKKYIDEYGYERGEDKLLIAIVARHFAKWQKEQKPTNSEKPKEWSEEDKDYYDTIVRKLEVIGDDYGLSDNQIKFLREHCPSHRSEWSEEDERNFYWISTTIQERHLTPEYAQQVHKILSWLKSLRPSWKPSEKQMLEEAVEKLESPISRSHENGAETDHTAAAIAVLTKRADVCHDLINRHIETMTYYDVSFYAGELAGYEQAIDLLKSSTESIRIEL